MVSRSAHPQIKTLTDADLKQKYSQVMLDNLKLKEMVEARDRIISEREMFPIYRYDKRVETLRKAVGHWYRKAEGDCKKMAEKMREMRAVVEEERGKLLH